MVSHDYASVSASGGVNNAGRVPLRSSATATAAMPGPACIGLHRARAAGPVPLKTTAVTGPVVPNVRFMPGQGVETAKPSEKHLNLTRSSQAKTTG